MPLQRRIPKRGFTNIFKKEYAIINLRDLNIFEDGTEVTPELLIETGLIKSVKDGVKILGDGDLDRKLTIKALQNKQTGTRKVTAKGGKVEVI